MTRSLKFLAVAALLIAGGCQSTGGVVDHGGVGNVGGAGTISGNENQRIVENLTTERMKRYFTDEDVRIDRDGDVIVRMNGYQVIVFVEVDDHSVLRHYTAIAGTDTTLVDLDEWNRERYFTKAYMNDEDDPALELVPNFEGGITVSNLRQSIRTYSQALAAFLPFLQAVTV